MEGSEGPQVEIKMDKQGTFGANTSEDNENDNNNNVDLVPVLPAKYPPVNVNTISKVHPNKNSKNANFLTV